MYTIEDRMELRKHLQRSVLSPGQLLAPELRTLRANPASAWNQRGTMRETCGEMRELTGWRSAGQDGFTLVELLIVIAMFSILVAVGFRGFRQFNESTTVDQAARALSSDVTLARSYAIRRAENVSLVANEAGRSYVIRDAGGTVLARGDMGSTSDTPLTLLDVKTTGDSITFNSRGMLTSGSTVEIDVGRTGLTKKVDVSPLGRTRVALVP